VPATLYDLIPRRESPAMMSWLGRFLDYVEGRRLQLFIPPRNQPSWSCSRKKNVVLNTPTGSGKSLVATALHFQAIRPGPAAPSYLPDQGAGKRKVHGPLPRVRSRQRRAQHRWTLRSIGMRPFSAATAGNSRQHRVCAKERRPTCRRFVMDEFHYLRRSGARVVWAGRCRC